MLDDANLKFIADHHDEIVVQICDSAASQGIITPQLIVSRMLKTACWREQRRVANEGVSLRFCLSELTGQIFSQSPNLRRSARPNADWATR